MLKNTLMPMKERKNANARFIMYMNSELLTLPNKRKKIVRTLSLLYMLIH